MYIIRYSLQFILVAIKVVQNCLYLVKRFKIVHKRMLDGVMLNIWSTIYINFCLTATYLIVDFKNGVLNDKICSIILNISHEWLKLRHSPFLNQQSDMSLPEPN